MKTRLLAHRMIQCFHFFVISGVEDEGKDAG